jgi:LytS/YehU family sensor histidine kinase
MNPHFIFNAMNSIQNFVIDNSTDDSLWYMGNFSKLIRQTLDFSLRKSISLEDEIDYLKRYIELENLRRKVKLKYDIIVEGSIDSNEIKTPPMLIEPLVENFFVHPFDNSILNLEMKIEFLIIESKFICKVSDNGLGYNPKEKSSKGLSLIKERIQPLNSNIKNSIVFNIAEKGTLVEIKIRIR